MTRRTRLHRRHGGWAACAALLAVIAFAPASSAAGLPTGDQTNVDVPAAVDPGTPTYAGEADPVPAEPAGAYDPSRSRLEAIYDADIANGGSSFWFDRVLARRGNDPAGSWLLTRGRALYMFNHNPALLGFGGGFAYRERPANNDQSLYTVKVEGQTLSETVADRVQYPSHWSSVHTGTGLRVEQRKFITQENTAVTVLRLVNTGSASVAATVVASSPIASKPSETGNELTGSIDTRYETTVVSPRLSGDGMSVVGGQLSRTVEIGPGGAATLKVQLGALTTELPGSGAEYERYRGLAPDEAFLTHVREYNRWWVDNVPYIDLPDENVEKMSHYRTFLNRYNYVDANIPGNDFQFPVSIEGVLGYNNAIQLTQPMHMQDLKYFRDPLWSYGNWVSSGESSKCTAFTDNPGSNSWGNTYEQYIAREAWNAYKVHGGERAIVDRYAYYSECDIKGQLAKFDTNNNSLIEYDWGALTGNDADAVALAYYNSAAQDRTESAFWYSGAKSVAEAYRLLGREDKALELDGIAGKIQKSVLDLLWDPAPVAPLPVRQCWPNPSSPLCGGKVFKQRDVAQGTLVPWKDQQNFSPFTEGLVPNTPEYVQALRFFADAEEFPIMPSYTANQRDKTEATLIGRGGSNNFSNINSTLQAQLFAKAIREYPSEHITPGMYRRLLEWVAWTQYIDGDNRWPDNNEFFAQWNETNKSIDYRSWIHHNILGAFNTMLIDDVAGMRPRLDQTLELWPVDIGWSHFTVNNLRYHGSDLTLVWDSPADGEDHYPGTPEGFSAYVDGQRAFTVSGLAHLTWDSTSGTVSILDQSGVKVSEARPVAFDAASEVRLSSNARVTDMFQKAGVDISNESGAAPNLALGKPVVPSYTATTPALRATDAKYVVDGHTVSGLPLTRRTHYVALNTIWGTEGSPNASDWIEVDLLTPQQVDTVKLYFYSDKAYTTQQNGSGGTYREPASYQVQYRGEDGQWVDVPGQVRSSTRPQANYNRVDTAPFVTRWLRVLVAPKSGKAVGIKELQVFAEGLTLPPPEPDTEPGGGGEDPGEPPVEPDPSNLARIATPSASYTSPWETVKALNDGKDPLSTGTVTRWGTWPNGGQQWIQLDWPVAMDFNRTSIWWFQDSADGSGSGVKRPLVWLLQYWNGTEWVNVNNPSAYGTERDKYNVTTFDRVVTTSLRAVLITRPDAQGVGAFEWKVSNSNAS